VRNPCVLLLFPEVLYVELNPARQNVRA